MGTRYHYYTTDGGPPSGGAPPGAPKNPPGFGPCGIASGPSPSFCFRQSAPSDYVCHPFPSSTSTPSIACFPVSCPPSMICHPKDGPPSMVCHPTSGSSASSRVVYVGDQACPNPAPRYVASFGPPPYSDSHPPGSRVKGLPSKFPGQSDTHVFPKSNCTFHFVKGDKKPWEWHTLILDVQVAHCATSMKLGEFIEQFGAVDRAPAGTPHNHIGVQEIIPGEQGVWHKGTAFTFGDGAWQMDQTLEEIGWGKDRGDAGKPVVLVFLP